MYVGLQGFRAFRALRLGGLQDAKEFYNMGVSENQGTLFGGPYNKNPTI